MGRRKELLIFDGLTHSVKQTSFLSTRKFFKRNTRSLVFNTPPTKADKRSVPKLVAYID